MIAAEVQRWRARRDSYRPAGEVFDPTGHEVAEPVPDRLAFPPPFKRVYPEPGE